MLRTEIGKTAGEIYQHLGKNGNVPLTELPNKVKKDPNLVHQAIGWLAPLESTIIMQGTSVTIPNGIT